MGAATCREFNQDGQGCQDRTRCCENHETEDNADMIGYGMNTPALRQPHGAPSQETAPDPFIDRMPPSFPLGAPPSEADYTAFLDFFSGVVPGVEGTTPALDEEATEEPPADLRADSQPSPVQARRKSSTSLQFSRLPGREVWSEADMDTMLQCKLVAVVGTGPKVWELADSRLQSRGRLLVLVTKLPPKGQYDDGGKFKWFPPKRVKPVGEQACQMARKYKARRSRRSRRSHSLKGPLLRKKIFELKKHLFRTVLFGGGEWWAHTLGYPGASPYGTSVHVRSWLCTRRGSEVPATKIAIF